MGHSAAQAHSFQKLDRSSFDCFTGFSSNGNWHHCIFQYRKFRKQMMELEDKTNMSISELCKLGCIPFEDIGPIEQHHTLRWTVQAAEQVEQSTFPCTRWP